MHITDRRYVSEAEFLAMPETLDKIRVPEHYTRGSATLNVTADIDKNRWARELPLSARAREVLDAVAPDEGPIFGPKRYIEDFKAAVLAAELPTDTAPYDLRHAAGTHGVEASGGNLTGVAFLLGHKQVTTTNRYVHSNARAAATVLAALDHSRISGSGSGSREPVSPPTRAVCNTSFSNDSRAVRRKGLEPLQELPHWNLNPARLPIPPPSPALPGENARPGSRPKDGSPYTRDSRRSSRAPRRS